MINHQLKTLPNGLRVITAPMQNTNAVTLLILIGVGSRFESEQQAGISHFLEHMFFKGSAKYPTYKEISEELDWLGGNYNAFTGEEYTGYYVQAAADKFPKALDILSDCFFNSTFPQPEVEREKGVIIEEINMYEDQPMSKVAEEAQKLVYGPTDLGRPIIGSKKTVSALGRNDLKAYHARMYQPTNAIITVAGASLDFDWTNAIERVFSAWKAQPSPNFTQLDFKQTKPQTKLIKRATDQAHFVLAFPTFAITDLRRPALRVLTNLLGGMMSARLFEEIREKRGLAYYVRAGIDDHHDSGTFSVSAGVKIDKIDEAVKVVLEELNKVAQTSPSPKELDRSQENMKGQIHLGLEDSQSVANFLANRILYYGKIIQPEEVVAEIEAVTAGQIQQLAQQIFAPAKRNLALIGPFEQEEKFAALIGT